MKEVRIFYICSVGNFFLLLVFLIRLDNFQSPVEQLQKPLFLFKLSDYLPYNSRTELEGNCYSFSSLASQRRAVLMVPLVVLCPDFM